MEKRKIILDCDPGHDDAIAIALAGNAENIELLGITVESGNQTIEKTTKNALNIVSYLGLDVPVYVGRSYPLKRKNVTCGQIHGESGLDGFDFPPHNKKAELQGATTFMYEALRKNTHVTIVTTGPMSNVARLILNYPEDLANLDEIIVMGGSIGQGNVTPAAEFNIFCDPEAARVCFKTGKVKMLGLDVTRKVLVKQEVVDRMEKLNTKASKMFVDLMKFFNKTQQEVFGLEAGPLHDPVTIAYLINPEVVKLQKVNVEIDCSGDTSYGRTNCDTFDYLKKEKNAYVAVDIDVDKYWDLIEDCLRRY